MTWRKVRTSMTVCKTVDVDVDVDLKEFDTAELLQSLVNRKAITESEAEKILAREDAESRIVGVKIIPDELEIATSDLRVGRRREALIHLERALGRDWVGVLAS